MKIIRKKNKHDRTPESIGIIVAWLKTLELFQGLFEEEDSFEQLAKAFTHKDINRDQMVFEEGDEGDYYYLVLEGEVDVLKYMQTEIPILPNPSPYERLLAYYNFIKNAGVKKLERESLFSTNEDRMKQLMETCHD